MKNYQELKKELTEEYLSKIAELDEEEKFAQTLPEIKCEWFIREYGYKLRDSPCERYAAFNITLKEDASALLKTLPAIPNGLEDIDHSSSPIVDYKTGERLSRKVPLYRLDLSSDYRHLNVKLRWVISPEFQVYLTMPAEMFRGAKLLAWGERNIGDTEYHYFTGHSYEDLRRLRVPAIGFAKGHPCFTFYKEHLVTANMEVIQEFIDFIHSCNQSDS